MGAEVWVASLDIHALAEDAGWREVCEEEEVEEGREEPSLTVRRY